MDAAVTKKPAELVQEYLTLRKAKKAAEAVYKDYLKANITDRMDVLEAIILDLLNTTGLDSFSSPEGTAYRLKTTSVTVADMREFRRHIIGSEDWDAADWRASKTYIDKLVEDNQPLPPGVNYTSFFTIGVRTKT